MQAPEWCECHGFGASEVSGALNAGAETVAQIFRHIGVCPKCGDCVPAVRDSLRKPRKCQKPIISPQQEKQKEKTMSKNTKVKIAIMLEDGDKLEYEAHLEETNLQAAKSQAEQKLKSAISTLSGRGDAISADRVKIETH